MERLQGRCRRLVLAGLIFGASAQSGLAGGIVIGSVAEGGASCTAATDPGEVYAVKPQLSGHADWHAHLFAKGAGGVGMLESDFTGGTFQILIGNFSLDPRPTDVVAVYSTAAGGRLSVHSVSLLVGFGFTDPNRLQQVGDSPPPPAGNPGPATLLELPDALGSWPAGLLMGEALFPRSRAGWPELAFAPVREIDTTTPTGSCATGGRVPDPDGSERLLAGYNVYRLATTGAQPARADVGQPGNWVDFVALPVTSSSQAELHDPDGEAQSGDEVLVWHDAPFARDGLPRRHGTAPRLGSGVTAWYAVQPVTKGDVSEFAAASLAHGPILDHRVDRNADGRFDAVDFYGAGSPDGPEFISPQADDGATGLGLTFNGEALLSKLMGVDSCYWERPRAPCASRSKGCSGPPMPASRRGKSRARCTPRTCHPPRSADPRGVGTSRRSASGTHRWSRQRA